MTRIPKKAAQGPASPDFTAQQELAVVLEEVAEQQETQAAQSAETSFFAADFLAQFEPPSTGHRSRNERPERYYAGKGLPRPRPAGAASTGQTSVNAAPHLPTDLVGPHHREQALAPYLREIQSAFPHIHDLADQELLDLGFGPHAEQALDKLDLATLRGHATRLHERFPHKALTQQVMQAWAKKVEGRLAANASYLAELEIASRKVVLGNMSVTGFYALCAQRIDQFRQEIVSIKAAVAQHALMGAGEKAFYKNLAKLADAYEAPLQASQQTGEAPSAERMRKLEQRLRAAIQLADPTTRGMGGVRP